MKGLFSILILLSIICVGCQFKMPANNKEEADEGLFIERYDRLEYRYLTTGDFSALQEMNTEYPLETRTLLEEVIKLGEATSPDINSRFLKFYQDTTLQALISAVEAEYANMDDLNHELNRAFKRLKKALPDIVAPRVYAQISALDQSIVVGNEAIGISLDKYLGEDYPLYKKYYSPDQRKQMTRAYIISDCLSFYLMSIYPLNNFDTRPQLERDLHVAKIQWVVNKVLSRHNFRSKYIDAVEKYMKNNPKTNYEELFRMTDFDAFEVV